MPNFKGKREYLKQCFGGDLERYVSYCFPLIMFHDNWKEIDFENFYAPGPGRYIQNYGYNEDLNTEVEVGVVPKVSEIDQKNLSSDSIAVLDNMVDECDKRV